MTWTAQRETLGRVLVINDAPNVRKLIRLTLMKAGYDVVEAADGEEALELLNSDKNSLAVDAIICDFRLSKINGMEAISYFCHQFPLIPVMALIGFPDIQLAI